MKTKRNAHLYALRRLSALVLAMILAAASLLGGLGSGTAYAVGPNAPTVASLEESINVGNIEPGATLKLHRFNDGQVVATAQNVTGTTYAFPNVVPDTNGYFVTQTLGGVVSNGSVWVNANLRTPTAIGGIGYIDVGNVYPGAAVTIYESDSSQQVIATPTDMGGGILRFTLPGRTSYYVMQSINGVISASTPFTSVQPLIPPAPVATGLQESIQASGYTTGATLKLYLSTGGAPVATSASVTDVTYTFANVTPNSVQYYVTQTVGGEESSNSNWVNASLRTPTATAGIGYVDIGNVYPGAAVTLYEVTSNQPVIATPTDMGGGTLRYAGLPARASYYAMQSINGVNSGPTAYATVQPSVPTAPTAEGLLESIQASGYTLGATLKLYLSTGGAPVATAASVTDVTYTFANVTPNSVQYYVTQTVGGEESSNSNWVNASLRTPTATAGIGYVDIGNMYPGAAVTLYEVTSNQPVIATPTALSGGTLRYAGLPARTSYYAIQSINGVNSGSTPFASIVPSIPPAPIAEGLLESILAGGYTSGATLKLYLSTGGAPIATAVSVTDATYIFANVTPNSVKYYVTQTVGDEESVNSSWVKVSLRTPTATAGIGYVDVGNVYPGAQVTLYEAAANQPVIVSPEAMDHGVYRFRGLAPGGSYYAVQSINGIKSEPTGNAELPAPPEAPVQVSAVAGDSSATVSFTAPGKDGGLPITGYEVTILPSNRTVVGMGSPITIDGLTNGTIYTFTVKAINEAGSSAASAASNPVTPTSPTAPSGEDTGETTDSDSGQPVETVQPNTPLSGIEILVNGRSEQIGTAKHTTTDGRSTVVVTVDELKLKERLAAEGRGATITIPMPTGSDIAVAELNGSIIKQLQEQAAVLEIKTEQSTYKLPANQLPLERIAAEFGREIDLSQLSIKITIAVPSADEKKRAEQATQRESLTLAAPPVEMKVSVSYGGKSLLVEGYSSYVERTISLPASIDPSRITTGVVLEPDGTVRHVPTYVIQQNGGHTAILNSLTNSLYAVVWHPVEFMDVSDHWAKQAVNDMGSRMVIQGTEEGIFLPDLDITRAEFTAIVTRGLGLQQSTGAAPSFTDVGSGSWYNGAVNTAFVYGLIDGFEDGTFRPNDRITREQAMVIFSRAMTITKLKGAATEAERAAALRPYADAGNAAGWAASGIADCLVSGLVSGRDANTLAPAASITRAEVAVMVQRLLRLSKLI